MLTSSYRRSNYPTTQGQHIINDSLLLHHITAVNPDTINGDGGNITTTAMGYLGLYGTLFKFNILASATPFVDPNSTQESDMSTQECIRVSHLDCRNLYFQRARDLYLCDFPAAWHHPLDDLDLPLPLPQRIAYPAMAIHDSNVLKLFIQLGNSPELCPTRTTAIYASC